MHLPTVPTIIRDTREKDDHGYKFKASTSCAGMVEEKLDFGDYAIQHHLDLIIIERKASVTELCNNIGKHRERFERELQRMVDAKVARKYIVIEDYYSSIFRQKYTKMKPSAIFESIMAFQVKYGVAFLFVGTKEMGHKVTRSLLLKAYKYRCGNLI